MTTDRQAELARRREYERRAQLPQITTVAELEALPEGSAIVDAGGPSWSPVVWRKSGRWHSADGALWSAGIVVSGPFTVVWQPEVTR